MNGAEALVHTAAEAGLEVCFANPGTTELPLVGALDAEPRVRPVLTLFEGVATGAADGYARIAGRPALTLLHLGPGLANGAACLHNARRAASPVVNVVGEHASWHLPHDPPLASDIAGLAATVSVWVHSSRDPAALAG
ncbi:MAG: thiamine pyrophosphate-binding protein, partial [Streptomycetales bacterium]